MTDILPFRKVRNHGIKDRYYVENSHEGIIPKEQFDKVQELIASKSTYTPKQRAKYTLAKKIRCGEYGHAFKRKVCNNKIYWSCYNHLKNKDNCSNKQIPETDIQNAFVTLFNTLKKNARHILIPMQSELQELQKKTSRNNQKIGQINKDIAFLTEQNHALNGLRSKGYMDSVVFMEQTSEINRKINKLRQTRRQLLDDEEDKTIGQTEDLIELLGENEELTEFSETIFADMVTGIIAQDRNTLKFILTNGLELVSCNT